MVKGLVRENAYTKVLKALKGNIKKAVSFCDTASIVAWNIFYKEIWRMQCEIFIEWEKSNRIAKRNKIAKKEKKKKRSKKYKEKDKDKKLHQKQKEGKQDFARSRKKRKWKKSVKKTTYGRMQ